MRRPARLAVFASGGGTNLQALLNRFNGPVDPVAQVGLVIASRTGIGALERAEAAGVPGIVIDPVSLGLEAAAGSILQELRRHEIDLVALAGYLKLVPAEVIERFRGGVVNIHPALLPAFGGPGMYGIRVHQAVLASGVMVSGATVHLVDERYDEGRILAQWPVPVLPDDEPGTLAARVLRVEHILYPLAIEALVGGKRLPPQTAEPTFELIEADAPAERSVRRLQG